MQNTCLCFPHGLFLVAETIHSGLFRADSHRNDKFITGTVERGRD